jgi:hypothetical protein
MMKERSQQLLSEVRENIDYMRSDVKNLSRYMVELEELAEVYRALASNAKLSTRDDLASKTRLLKERKKSLDYQQTSSQSRAALRLYPTAFLTMRRSLPHFEKFGGGVGRVPSAPPGGQAPEANSKNA